MQGTELDDAGAFDFVIVGAGSAGCVLANRLSAGGLHSVAVLEAGPEDRDFWIHLPLGYAKLFRNPRVNWMFETAPESELNGRRVYQPRGKVLGGSSSINGLVYIRGQREDFEHWRQLGNSGWSADDVLHYFRRAEGNIRGADDQHGGDGPLGVSDPHTHELTEAFIAAAEHEGLPRTRDFNGLVQEGVGYFQTTSRNGRRCSAAVAYLHPARKRQNLKVFTDALTDRVILSDGRATGVVFRRGGIRQVVHARREIILAAGAYGSPTILQRSGLGPAELLSSHGIPVIHDMPGVGSDLQDHLQARCVVRCTKPITLNDMTTSMIGKVRLGLEWLLTRSGWLTIAAGHAGAFFRTDARLASPDVQVHFIPFSTDKMGDSLHPFPGFMAHVCQLRPESRGTVRITSSDPGAVPEIRMNYLSAETDRATMLAGLKRLRAIMHAPPLRPYFAAEVEPGPDAVTDDALMAHIRAKASTVYHPTSTCRMGSDPRAVVDSGLRVRGVDGLRVADCAIMPTLVSGNTNAAAIMIGEKASDIILADTKA
ncbi:GMC family oxidoreductase [Elioraea rosea]|uniref:GMC family oxidoreductase n=1 Tax=Elioraea rosea TaxID=2492390 RepID=UPI0011826E4C|nr:choline dehydrogenase [Elioraea rosea]